MARRQIYKTKVDGKRVPSVTTILGKMKDPGGLMYWANQMGLDGLTLQEARNQVANPGTMAHDLVEAHINGWDEPEFPGVKKESVGLAKQALRNFIKWQKMSRMAFRYTEVSLVSDKHRFGGRLDAIGQEPEGDLCIVDFKTGGLYAEHLFQVAAYHIMWNENYPDDLLTGGAHLLSFKRETADFAHHYFGNFDYEMETFIQMRHLYDRIKNAEKRVK